MEQENQLITQLKSGNMQAFQELVNTYSRRLYTAAYRVLGEQGIAEDCIQEVFIKVHQKIGDFDERSKLSTWLYSVTVNTAIDMQRKLARHYKDRHDDEESLGNAVDEKDSNPENAQWQRNLSALTAAALKHLNEELRVAFLLRHFEGHSIQEISEILEINPNTVKNRIFRAVQKLKSLLEPQLSSMGDDNYESI